MRTFVKFPSKITASIQEDFERITSKGRWSGAQLDELMYGLQHGLDVEQYANPKKFNAQR